jgi:short-subunit dehydrogenase
VERLEELTKECEGMLGELFIFSADVTQAEAMQKAVAHTLAQFNRLDVLIANAGLGHRGALIEAAWEDLETVLQTNVYGILHSIRACVPAMRASGGGHIITISSILGAVPAPYSAIYSASKATVDSLAQSSRVELKADHIWVTNMQIGQTHSEFAEKRLGQQGRVASTIPTMTPERVALQIVRVMEKRRRTVIIRPFDRFFVIGGRFFPRVMDRILAKVYGSKVSQ